MRKLLTAGLLGVFLLGGAQAEELKIGSKKVVLTKKIGKAEGELYDVRIDDPVRGISLESYGVVVRRDGKTFYFLIPYQKKDSSLVPVLSLKPLELSKDSQVIKTLEKVVKEAQKEGINLKLSEGKKRAYLIADVLCPYCVRAFNKEVKELENKGYEVYYIPFAVHRDRSLKVFSCLAEGDFVKNLRQYYSKAEKEGLPSAFKSFSSCTPSKEKEKFFRETFKELVGAKIYSTPTVLVEESNGKFLFRR